MGAHRYRTQDVARTKRDARACWPLARELFILPTKATLVRHRFSCLTLRPRRSAVAVLVTVLCALAIPATASAGQDTIWNGLLSTGGWGGPRHSLTSVWATYYGGGNSCLNAVNSDGSGWAGASVCAYPGDTNRGHAYCGCQLRAGYGWSGGPGDSWGYWRQFW